MLKLKSGPICTEELFCPGIIDFDTYEEDLVSLAKKFKLEDVPKYMEFYVQPELVNKIRDTVALMKERDYNKVAFYAGIRRGDLNSPSKVILLNSQNEEIQSPFYPIGKDISPRPVFSVDSFSVAVQYPFNSFVQVNLTLSNGFTEATIYGHFRLKYFLEDIPD